MNFVDRVIGDLNEDNFLRKIDDLYPQYNRAMSKDSEFVSCAVGGEWSMSVFGIFVELQRGRHTIPLSFGERLRLVSAFRGAMKRLKRDHNDFLRNLKK